MIYILLLVCFSLGNLFYGIKNITDSKGNKNSHKYYSGINYLISGLLGILFFIIYLIFGQSWIALFFLGLMFILPGLHGIIFRNKIKSSITFRIDFFALIIGLLINIFLIFYILELLPFQM